MTIRIELTAETVEDLTAQVAALNDRLAPARASRGYGPRLKGLGEDNPGTRRTDDEVRAMLARANEIGVGRAAAEFGVNQSWLSRIRGGHIWKHLTRPAA